MHAFVLLGLTFIGIIWTVGGGTSLRNSASSTSETERTRQRRAAATILTQEERIGFLKAHNMYRSNATGALKHPQPTAADMKRMYWNVYLEADAQSWSQHMCAIGNTEHGHTGVLKLAEFTSSMSLYGTAPGQNLYRGGRSVPSVAIAMYASEGLKYTYGPTGWECVAGSGKGGCGHYTQVMWSSSSLVGCGSALCDDKTFYSACNYLIPGNMGNTPPYTSGVPCSMCALDKKFNFTECENNLCVPKDRCSPVKECTVVDKDNCLCSEEDYKTMVERLVKAQGSSHAASPLVVISLLLLLPPLFAVLLDQEVQPG